MGLDFFEGSAAAREIFDLAAANAPEGFLDTIFHGEADALTNTRVAQPGLLIVEVAIAAHLKQQGVLPTGCAGHSLGEIPALTVAGVLDFVDALKLTFERARLMSENVPQGTMAAVMGLDPAAIEANLPEGAQVANYNGPGQTIISGTLEAMEKASVAIKEAGAKRVLPLNVSGPFHSECMRPAVAPYTQFLDTLTFRAPSIRFISGVSGKEECDPAQIKQLLGQQLVSPVRWTEVMAAIGAVDAIEAGPGNVLAGLCKRTDGAPSVRNVGTLAEAAAL